MKTHEVHSFKRRIALYVGRNSFIIQAFCKTEQATLLSQCFYQKTGNKVTNHIALACSVFKLGSKHVMRATIFCYIAFMVLE